MPVPPDKQKLYGKIVGKNIHDGKDPEEAKDIADRAIKHRKPNKNKHNHPWKRG